MTALGKLFRTTAFKLSLAYLVIFVLFASALLGYVAFNMRRLLDAQVSLTIEEDVKGLVTQFKSGGLRRLVAQIERRASQPGSSLYLVTTPLGEILAGNISGIDPEGLLDAGRYQLFYRVLEDGDSKRNRALVDTIVLPGGFRLLVGRDLSETDRFRGVIRSAIGWSIVLVLVMAVAGGVFVARRVLGRIDAMTATTRSIMAGDFSGRLAVSGTNDELDRLAQNLNAMLDRIAELMAGLREVSDNIAHDLKTPLTRLRNAAEEALRTATDTEEYRLTLENVIDEADQLIQTFNALLMIARAESGNATEGMASFDAADVARDVAELYEPLAEEAGVVLHVGLPEKLPFYGSRELIGQALANLLDNAIKYAARGESDPEKAEISIGAVATGAGIEVSVSDNGPGIPEADRARVVERFVRLEGSRSRPGSGLGLSLASAVARLHGGTLRLEDHAPGLRVVLALPVKGIGS
ncbi:MAG: sensor histidine kinase [Hyphomicrobiales bacterium]